MLKKCHEIKSLIKIRQGAPRYHFRVIKLEFIFAHKNELHINPPRREMKFTNPRGLSSAKMKNFELINLEKII